MDAGVVEISPITLLISFAVAFAAGYGTRSFASYRRRRRWLMEYGVSTEATRARRL